MFISLTLLLNLSFALSLEEQYKEARIDFLKSSLKQDEVKKINDLKRIIDLGKKLKKNTTPDEKKLQLLLQKLNKSTLIQNKIEKNSSSINKDKKEINYPIKAVYTSKNSIIVDFNIDISKDDIKFFELKPSPLYRDVFDIKGYFKDALQTKLKVASKEKISIGQFTPDTLRIVVSSNTNPDTSYTLSKKRLIINIGKNTKRDLEVKADKVTAKVNNLDIKNPISSVSSFEDKIIIELNKSLNEKDIKLIKTKNSSNFEYILDINAKYKFAQETKLKLNNVNKIITIDKDNKLRIRFINKSELNISHSLSKNQILIEVRNPNKNILQNISVQKEVLQEKKAIKKTIVIDAGHGGEDVGAVGPNKRYEKVVNLEVTKYLEAILKQRGYTVYLTRKKDTFIKVINRTILANEKNADLFISIHTNSIVKEKANTTSGVETFFLSPARSERAKRVAALENKSDIRIMSESTKNTFLESLNRPRITASHKFAIDVQAGILEAVRKKYKDVNDSGVREGPFWVLVGAQMPSILVELGYISHPEESRRLYEKEYQQLLANGIANGIDSYFAKNP